MTFTSYEIPEVTCMGLNELREYWEFEVDHESYPEFEGWLWDMKRSATIFVHE